MEKQDDSILAVETYLGPYAELTEEQKKLIGGTRLALFICASGLYPTAEAALEEIVRLHNEVGHINDIDSLFKTHPGVFRPKPVNVETSKPLAVSRPLRLMAPRAK